MSNKSRIKLDELNILLLDTIQGIKDVKLSNNQNNFMFHAGTISKNDKIFANGGRVLNFVSISESYLEARKSAIDKIKDLNWCGGFFRKDIGFKAID